MTIALPVQRRLEVGTLALEVLSGPDAGVEVQTEGDTLSIGTATNNSLSLRDPTVSQFHAELSRGPEGIRVVDLGSTNGTWLGDIRLRDAVVPPVGTLRLGDTSVRVGLGKGVTVALAADAGVGDVLGRSEPLQRVMASAARIGASGDPVLIIGEPGTGKPVLARWIHDNSPRAARPFVEVDCGSMVPGQLAAELFGYEAGAFPGAQVTTDGALARAHGGTLFLAAFQQLPRELQAQLAVALELRRFPRLGSRVPRDADVRIVAATDRDLRADVNAGGLRMDLYYRVAGTTVAVPPLRDRVEDIPPLVASYLQAAGHDGVVEQIVSSDMMETLKKYRWPGNLWELRDWVETAVTAGATTPFADARGGFDPEHVSYRQARARLLDSFERDYCTELFARSGGNVSKASRIAGMDRSYLIKLLSKHGIKKS